jgi:hypothetical protein
MLIWLLCIAHACQERTSPALTDHASVRARSPCQPIFDVVEATLWLVTRACASVQSGSAVDSDEEEGKDWDELEDEARRSDKMKDDEDGGAGDGGGGARKRKGVGRGRGPPAKKRR